MTFLGFCLSEPSIKGPFYSKTQYQFTVMWTNTDEIYLATFLPTLCIPLDELTISFLASVGQISNYNRI